MSFGDVCVVIAAYNAQGTIGRAVASALAQKYVQEVVVCDDGSHDETSKMARMEDDGTGRLSIITLTKNAGPSGARNVAIASSRSPIICLLDSDDYFLPGRIARLVEAGTGEWDLLADDIIIVPEELAEEGFPLPALEPLKHNVLLDLRAFVTANIAHPGRPRGEWGFLKPLMKRAFLDEHGLCYDEGMRLGEDYALYVRALVAGARFRLTGACGYVAIERDNSISSEHSAADLKKIADFDARCLSSESKLTAAERSAIAAHAHATQQRFAYRTVLDIKKDRGWLPAVGALLHASDSWFHIFGETLRAKMGRANGGGGAVRLLVGALPNGKAGRDGGRSAL
jgi:succinoglycan biosynthesis protein ExoU